MKQTSEISLGFPYLPSLLLLRLDLWDPVGGGGEVERKNPTKIEIYTLSHFVRVYFKNEHFLNIFWATNGK